MTGIAAEAGPATRIEARGVRVVRGGRAILDGVTLSVPPGALVGIIGASGAGKTVLLEALAGIRRPSAGTVRHLGGPGSGVGFVPQDDIVHLELPLAVMLRYAARLRLPADAGREGVDRRVDDVLAALGLTRRAGVRVGWLSGGERKRASIAVELLTRPGVFLLDEPTSGLDPLTAEELVRGLRELADGGTGVALTTHHAADAEVCDQLVVLSAGGRVAFAGPPAAAAAHFGVSGVGGIYRELARGAGPVTPEPERGASPEPGPEPEPAPGRDPGRDRPREPDPAQPRTGAIGGVRQCLVLARRTAAILVRNRLTLGILLGSPLVILAMFVMLFRPGAFDPATASPSTEVMILFWIAFGGFFFGLTYGLLQICTELPIVRREQLAGVRPVPYVLSKVLVLVPLLAVVDLLLLGLLRVLDRLPALEAGRFAEMYVTLLLATVAALGLGLLCSAAVSDPAQATLALPMLCFPQVLFVGAILPVPLMAPVGRWLSAAMSNRWSFEALGHTAGLPQLWATGPSRLGPPLLADYGSSFDRPVWQNWCLLAAFTLIALAGATGLLAARARAGRRG